MAPAAGPASPTLEASHPSPEPASEAESAPGVVTAVAEATPVVADDTASREAYEAGMKAFLGGDFSDAAQHFSRVKAGPQRAAAAELQSLASRLAERGARLTYVPDSTEAVPSMGPPELDQAGRAGFVVSSTLAGIYTGAYILDLADVEDFRVGVAILLGTTAGGVLASYYGTEGRRMTDPMADAYSTGLVFGAANGLLLGAAAEPRTSEGLQTAVFLGMGLGGVGGLLLADAVEPTRGQVGFAGLTGTMGFATLGLSLGIIQPANLEPEAALIALAVGLDAGTVAGMLLGADLDWSVSRQRYVGLGTFLGALGGWGAAALVTGSDAVDSGTGRVWSGAALAGLAGGFALSIHLTRDMHPDPAFARREQAWSVAPFSADGAHGLAIAGQF